MDKSEILKNALLEALNKSLGVVSTACKAVACSRKTFYQYYKEDPEFKTQVDEIENVSLDFAESKLFGLMNDGNPAAIIFYLKTKGKNRGYVERMETVAKIENELTGKTKEELQAMLEQLKRKN